MILISQMVYVKSVRNSVFTDREDSPTTVEIELYGEARKIFFSRYGNETPLCALIAALNHNYNRNCALPSIKKVIFNDPATIVFWKDGTKTVAKCHDEVFDKEKGLFAAIAKKAYAKNGNLPRSIAKYLK